VPHPHRIGLPRGDGPYQTNTIYTRNTVRSRQLRGIAPTALISHSGTAGQQPREPVGATRNKPAVGPAYNAPGTGLWRRVQDMSSSSFASIHPRLEACFAAVNFFISFPDDLYQFNCR
jgi:hypothetical protein